LTLPLAFCAGRSLATSIQRPPEPRNGNRHRDEHQGGKLAGLGAVALAVGPTPAGEILLANTAVVAALVALAFVPPRPVVWLAAAVTGAALGLDSPPEEISIELATIVLIGTGLGACIALALVIGLTSYLRRDWQRLAVRIIGSWIAASAMLVLAVRLTR